MLIPDLCEGDPAVVAEAIGIPVEKGPKDLREIPRHFGRAALAPDYGAWDIEIVADITNAPRLSPGVLNLRGRSCRRSVDGFPVLLDHGASSDWAAGFSYSHSNVSHSCLTEADVFIAILELS